MKFTSKAKRGKVFLAQNQKVKLSELYNYYGKEFAEKLINIKYFEKLNIVIKNDIA